MRNDAIVTPGGLHVVVRQSIGQPYPRHGIKIHAKVVTAKESRECHGLTGRPPGSIGGGYTRLRCDFYQETTRLSGSSLGMSVFCPYDYVAAEVNPYPVGIIGREVKPIAGNRDSTVVRGEEERVLWKEEDPWRGAWGGGGGGGSRVAGRRQSSEDRSRVKITRRDTPRRRNSNEPRD